MRDTKKKDKAQIFREFCIKNGNNEIYMRMDEAGKPVEQVEGGRNMRMRKRKLHYFLICAPATVPVSMFVQHNVLYRYL